MALEKSTLTEKNNITVYNATTQPKKPKRRDKSDLGPDFIAPDGGWGWVVCLAAGFGNLSIFPALQQYGLIYRKRMHDLGFTSTQTTTLVNFVMAISSLVGIVNGAMFRRFTFRQVAICGSILVFTGILGTSFCTTYVGYLICFSCIYAIGLGSCMASTSLAVNTYFKNRRRRATGFSWTITGLGPIIFPYVTIFLLAHYGVQGTIQLYAALGLNALLCACTLQPVLWHSKKPIPQSDDVNGDVSSPLKGNTSTLSDEPEYECKYCQYQKRGKRSIFTSQYLFNEDDPEKPGYEITEPGTPMLARANDGWYGSKMSLASEQGTRYRRQKSVTRMREALEAGKRDANTETDAPLYKPNYFHREREDFDRYTSRNSVYSKTGLDDFHCTCAEEKALLQKITDEDKKIELENLRIIQEADELARSKMTFKQKVVKFFDLDLLKDFTFVNLALGMTLMMIGEMNFSVLTPFILNSFNYSDDQISFAMSLLGAMDISVRFFAPFALEKVKIDNRALFAFGIIAITIGRFIVTLSDSFSVIIGAFILIGFGKGFRTLFSPLIMPSYVPLRRLPAASGLQLVCNAIFTVVFGLTIGTVTDAYGYRTTIHLINGLACFALLMWLTESIVRRILGKKAVPME